MEIKEAALKIAKIEGVEGIILFGSFARGTAGRGSDIDVLVIYQGDPMEIQGKITNIALKMNLKLEPILKTLEEIKTSDVNFITNILQDGKVMFLTENVSQRLSAYLGFAPYTIFSYDTSGIEPKQRTRFYRSLFGARWKKGAKTYSHRGILEELNGLQLGGAVIMMAAHHKRKIEKFFDGYGIEYKERHVFVKL